VKCDDFLAITTSSFLRPLGDQSQIGDTTGLIEFHANPACPANTSPLPHQRPAAKQTWLNVQLVEARQVVAMQLSAGRHREAPREGSPWDARGCPCRAALPAYSPEPDGRVELHQQGDLRGT
jgi:hypothetical protein